MINVGILGNGTVGSGVVELLFKNMEYIRKRTGETINISKILVKDVKKHIHDKNKSIITDNIDELFETNLDIVVEAMGGLDPAFEYIKKFLSMRVHVVTANKDIISKYGQELAELAHENRVSLNFEASVGGGIPIIKPLRECLAGNEIKSIIAILNGTTNFILSKMYNESMEYESALRIAQGLGFAEANPDSDVLGFDTARKLGILSSISFKRRIRWENINIEGITDIDETDINCAKELNCTIKLIAMAIYEENEIYAKVSPLLVPVNGHLGKIDNEFNGILINGDAVGQMFFYGKGAGKFPTASAVLGDILDVIENRKEGTVFSGEEVGKFKTHWDKSSSWLLRIKAFDKNAAISSVSKQFNISSVLCESCGTDEVALTVHVDNEELLEAGLTKLSERDGLVPFKKRLILDL